MALIEYDCFLFACAVNYLHALRCYAIFRIFEFEINFAFYYKDWKFRVVKMKTSLRFEHTPQVMEKVKRRRRRKIKSPDQPMVEIVNVQEQEHPVMPKWVSISINHDNVFNAFKTWIIFSVKRLFLHHNICLRHINNYLHTGIITR